MHFDAVHPAKAILRLLGLHLNMDPLDVYTKFLLYGMDMRFVSSAAAAETILTTFLPF